MPNIDNTYSEEFSAKTIDQRNNIYWCLTGVQEIDEKQQGLITDDTYFTPQHLPLLLILTFNCVSIEIVLPNQMQAVIG